MPDATLAESPSIYLHGAAWILGTTKAAAKKLLAEHNLPAEDGKWRISDIKALKDLITPTPKENITVTTIDAVPPTTPRKKEWYLHKDLEKVLGRSLSVTGMENYRKAGAVERREGPYGFEYRASHVDRLLDFIKKHGKATRTSPVETHFARLIEAVAKESGVKSPAAIPETNMTPVELAALDLPVGFSKLRKLADAAVALGVDGDTMADHCLAGRLKFLMAAGVMLVTVESLEALKSSQDYAARVSRVTVTVTPAVRDLVRDLEKKNPTAADLSDETRVQVQLGRLLKSLDPRKV